jgi:hypothetical protein
MLLGLFDADDAWMIEDYTINTSVDDVTYIERVSETGNSDHFRTHLLASGVPARYVRVDIDAYSAGEMTVTTESDTETFEGAFVREIEVLETGNLNFVNSEVYPIVAINLQDTFRITGHSLTPIDPDDTTNQWNNNDNNFRYSANTFAEPYKITYSAYGGSSSRVRWLSVKRDTATEWNSGPDYLDNVRALSGGYHRIQKFPWWWTSDYSTLSTDYSVFSPDTDRSIKIEYTGGPTSSGADEVSFIEGTSLGTDAHMSEMDLLSIDLYIPDVTKLAEYGSVTFGDYTGLRYHSWDLSTTVSGFSNGWNLLKLKFKDADIKMTNEGLATYYAGDVTALNNYQDLELKSFKFAFRGRGDPFTIYLDNLRIERNAFYDTVKFGKGLYLSNNEYVSFPLSEFDPHQGSLEFWLKPDYNYYGVDNFYTYHSRTLFCFSNIANDLFGLFILMGRGLAIVTGSSNYVVTQYAERSSSIWFDAGDVVHIGFVWSNDGTAIDSFGTTIRLYLNNELIGRSYNTWDIRDTKTSRLLLGGAVSEKAASFYPTSFWAVIDNLKVYNYCKTDFSDKDIEDIDSIDVRAPNSFLEISDDGINFYDRNSANLPLFYKDVPPGESRTVWVRTNIPRNLTGAEKRTAELIIEAIRSF